MHNQATLIGRIMSLTSALLNIAAGVILLLLSLPFFIFIPLLIRYQDGPPTFYAGRRLGKDKNSFTLYKFRTLSKHAEQTLGAELVSRSGRHLELPIGRYLRDTRIDELPQLFNVLKGDMNIIGPRPERQVVYEQCCRHLGDYDRRFLVKPGLIGYSQLFTPHSTAKRIRAKIDNAQLRPHLWLVYDLTLLCYALTVLLLALLGKTLQAVAHRCRRQSFTELRHSDRIRPGNCHIALNPQPDNNTATPAVMPTAMPDGTVVDVSAEALHVILPWPLTKKTVGVTLTTTYRSLGQWMPQHKSMRCRVRLQQSLPPGKYRGKPDEHHYILAIESLSPLNHLKLHKYFLHHSIC